MITNPPGAPRAVPYLVTTSDTRIPNALTMMTKVLATQFDKTNTTIADVTS